MFRGHLKIILLRTLAEKKSSGYELMKRLQEKIGCKPSPGSLYPLLDELASHDLVSSQEKGKSKIYSITSKGKAELTTLEQKRNEILQTMASNMKMWGVISGEDVSFQLGIFERLSKGELPFGDLSQEMCELKDTMATFQRADSQTRKTVKRVLQATTKQLKKLQKQGRRGSR